MRSKILKAILHRIPIFLIITVFVVMYFVTAAPGPSTITEENGKTYIVDIVGERWDITQAVSLGFDPDGFEFGVGRNAFTTLDDSLLTDDGSDMSKSARVIGIGQGSDARAYSIAKLMGHEISNSALGLKPIAVAF